MGISITGASIEERIQELENENSALRSDNKTLVDDNQGLEDAVSEAEYRADHAEEEALYTAERLKENVYLRLREAIDSELANLYLLELTSDELYKSNDPNMRTAARVLQTAVEIVRDI